MKPRHVVTVGEGNNDQLTVFLSKAPVNVKDARRPQDFPCNPDSMPPWQAPGAVRLHGKTLYEKLVGAHPAINQVLTTALQTPNQSPALYFHLLSDDAERFAWETLYEQQNGFLALQCQWAIARMADSSANIDRAPIVVFDAPLRVMALLSAHNVSAQPEWQQLKTAVKESRGAGFPVSLSVLVGEEPLFNQIESEVAAEGLTDITVAPLPNATEAIKDAVNTFAPHILHFFAHGSVGFGAATLQMAHFGDAGLPSGSIRLAVSELLRFDAIRDVWLVTLNCCETGRAVPDMHSMAHRLVADGVPAALGMMEPIAPVDAHQLCGAFYRSTFKYLQSVLANNATADVEIEWSHVLHPIRSALKDFHIQDGDPDSRREWTLPVLYVRPDRFFVTRKAAPTTVPRDTAAPADPEMRRRLDMIGGFLRNLPPDAPEDLRSQTLQLLNDVPEALRPDKFGVFRAPSENVAGVAAGAAVTGAGP